jgi:hypothetical protein
VWAGVTNAAEGDYVRHTRAAVRFAHETGDQGLQLAQRSFLAFASTFAGRLVEGVESCETAGRTLPADPALGIEFTGYSPLVGLLAAHAWLLFRLGRLDESTTVCDRAESLARAHGDVEVLTWVQLPRCEADVLRGDVSAARRRARAALETGARATTPQSLWVGPFLTGIVSRLDGAWDESIARLEGLETRTTTPPRVLPVVMPASSLV